MLSEFFIISPRGDPLIYRDYRGETAKGSPEIFYKKIRSTKEKLPPIFNVEGLNFIFIKRNGLFFVCTSKFNLSSAFAVEVLSRVCNLCKDYCGIINEEAIKCNLPLIYELLDEVLDFGYVQATSTEALKAYVFNQPELVENSGQSVWQCSGGNVYGTERMSLPSTAANKPVVPHKTNEIFVDLLERLTVLISPNGSILRSDIDGCIQMKSFLTGSPDVRIALTEDLTVGNADMPSQVSSMGVKLADCNFHKSVNLDEFESSRTLSVLPPDGEFTVMSYRVAGELETTLPFSIITFVDENEEARYIEVMLKLRCNIPSSSSSNNIIVRVPVPKSTERYILSHDVGHAGHSAEYKTAEKLLLWQVKSIRGGAEVAINIKLKLKDKAKSARKELGPVSLDFEIPMYICSGLQIRSLKVYEKEKAYHPFRWVRYIT
ncbi:predicted protein, partial [Nematostella vectensis]